MSERLRAAGDLDLLVILDNCEHVIDAAAEVAGLLCTGGSRIRVIATSRERLEVAGEHVWPVQPLPPAAGGRELLVDRARASRPDVDLGDLGLLDRVLDRLDGLPLAIEMAASQLAATSLAELDRALDDGLTSLTTRRRDAPARHRTVGDVVRWTTERIDEVDRDVLAELSVFAGPIDVDGAGAVTRRPGVGAVLRRLAARSLLTVDTTGPESSFSMIGPIRACAAELLAADGRTDLLAGAHAAHVVALARDADRELRTEREASALERLDRAVPDLRAAHRWLLAHDRPAAFALNAALLLYGQIEVRLETLGWATELVFAGAPATDPEVAAAQIRGATDAALAEGTDPDDVAATLAAAGHAAVLAGDLRLGLLLSSAGTGVAGTDRGWWAALEVRADVALFEGRLDEAVALLEPIDRVPDDPHRAVLTLLGRMLPAAYRGDRAGAEALLDQLLQIDATSPSDRAWMAYAEGDVILDRDAPRAVAALERAVALADEVNDRYIGGIARVSLCALLARVGDTDVAARRFVEVIDQWRRQGARTHLLTTLRNLPILLERLGRFRAALELIAALDHIDDAPTWGDEAERLAAVRARVAEVLDAATHADALAVGAGRSLDDAARAGRAELADVVAPT
jgi:predicted ATPase